MANQMNIHLDSNLRVLLRTMAAMTGRSITALVEQMVYEGWSDCLQSLPLDEGSKETIRSILDKKANSFLDTRATRFMSETKRKTPGYSPSGIQQRIVEMRKGQNVKKTYHLYGGGSDAIQTEPEKEDFNNPLADESLWEE